MEPELTALATAGATALVQQMTTEAWATVRRRMASFLARRRGTADEEVLEGELEGSRADVVTAQEEDDAEGVTGVTLAWRLRLRRLLSEDPQAAAELRALLDELQPPGGPAHAPSVTNSITGGVQHGTVIQAGTVSDLTIGAPGRPAPQ
ncbi:hypothetical protein [Streptomyces sp. NPDC048650]|uniref:hypothetical protein n=1 Tax=unclassified Streptomyces TaxID=2593676 RepID=UPI0037168A69